MKKKEKYLISPNIDDKSLITELNGLDENSQLVRTKVINEKSLTIFLNNQEIVTLMTIGDHPKYLAIGYLLNQNMLKKNDKVSKVEIDKEGSLIDGSFFQGIIESKARLTYEKANKFFETNEYPKELSNSLQTINKIYILLKE